MFRAFGHVKSSVLNGGLPAWEENGGLTESVGSHTPNVISGTSYPEPELDEKVVKSTPRLIRSFKLYTAF